MHTSAKLCNGMSEVTKPALTLRELQLKFFHTKGRPVSTSEM